MVIIEAIAWCIKNPYKRCVLAPKNKYIVFFDKEKNMLSSEVDGEIELRVFDINEYDFDDDGWEEFVEMVPFKDLFGNWCHKEQIYCTIDSIIWKVRQSTLELYTDLPNSKYLVITNELANQPIWWRG